MPLHRSPLQLECYVLFHALQNLFFQASTAQSTWPYYDSPHLLALHYARTPIFIICAEFEKMDTISHDLWDTLVQRLLYRGPQGDAEWIDG